MKMILTAATSPAEYIECQSGWQRGHVEALRLAVREAASEMEERLKWGHIVYFLNGPVLLIRAEPTRLLFGFWRGQRLRSIEPRLKPGGKYEMATLELRHDTPLSREAVMRLVVKAAELNQTLGNPAIAVPARKQGAP